MRIIHWTARLYIYMITLITWNLLRDILLCSYACSHSMS